MSQTHKVCGIGFKRPCLTYSTGYSVDEVRLLVE